ncbi:hypothetical protein LPJ78_004803 [Coemansia sp. RSA 989]|nr:hypothetical protein BX667DRAFT_507651 [Coemansia mojavensis]KAJ1862299.1 hypothetical protein LPJ78_004803 [Coemansia sp. RSA 989]KAJ1870606.1 hypothetical protein LPJ55_004540 [Coemansia sp. RSA 990]KAJ2668269.1 hypothetical protein IWW42_005326 [Coemansia sp. RSA 1085]
MTHGKQPVAPEEAGRQAQTAFESALDDNVEISLGLQQTLGRAWSLGVSWVGSLSLAWQEDIVSDVPEITTASVFGTQPEHEPASRSRTSTGPSYRSRRTAKSDDVNERTLKTHQAGISAERRIDGTLSDNTAAGSRRIRRKRDPNKKKKKLKDPADNTSRKRKSKRRHRLPVPKEPCSHDNTVKDVNRPRPLSLSGNTLAPAYELHAPSPPTPLQRHSACSPRHRRSHSLPANIADRGSLYSNEMPSPSYLRQPASATIAAATPLTDEQYMVMLEGHVSEMFVELGLSSPYSAGRFLPEDDASESKEPWFRGCSHPGCSSQRCSYAKYIVLIDDDSSFSE